MATIEIPIITGGGLTVSLVTNDVALTITGIHVVNTKATPIFLRLIRAGVNLSTTIAAGLNTTVGVASTAYTNTTSGLGVAIKRAGVQLDIGYSG